MSATSGSLSIQEGNQGLLMDALGPHIQSYPSCDKLCKAGGPSRRGRVPRHQPTPSATLLGVRFHIFRTICVDLCTIWSMHWYTREPDTLWSLYVVNIRTTSIVMDTVHVSCVVHGLLWVISILDTALIKLRSLKISLFELRQQFHG